MGNKVDYEWTIELADAHGDIQDSEHYDKLKEAIVVMQGEQVEGLSRELLLKRIVSNEYEGRVSEGWAYVKAGVLPTEFRGCYNRWEANMPKRFIKEFETVMGGV